MVHCEAFGCPNNSKNERKIKLLRTIMQNISNILYLLRFIFGIPYKKIDKE